jgi:hypothetical protein
MTRVEMSHMTGYGEAIDTYLPTFPEGTYVRPLGNILRSRPILHTHKKVCAILGVGYFLAEGCHRAVDIEGGDT